MRFFHHLILAFSLSATPALTLAQGAQVAFGSTQQDSDLPVEVTSDNLNVNQNDGTAVFTGNVVIGQGEMRLSADRVLVVYRQNPNGVERLEATGNVILVSGTDAAESQKADYNVDDGTIVMTGSVLLAQGPSALSADKMTVQLNSGTAQMSGSVRTILQTGDQ